MKRLKKLSLFLLIFVLVFQTISIPAFADTDDLNTKELVSEKATIITNDESEDLVPLFKDFTDLSEVIISLEDGTTVEIIEVLEDFTSVNYLDPDTEELISGYINNENLKPIVESVEETEIATEEVVVETVDEVDVNEENSLEEDKLIEEKDEDSSTTNSTQEEGLEDSNLEENTKDETKKENIENKNAEEKTSSEPSNNTSMQTFSISVQAVGQPLYGVALKNPTKIYSSQSTNSKILKDYKTGSILKYYKLNNNWYETGVYINGKKHTGYIHKNDVDTATNNPETLSGVALKNQTTVYASASTSAKALKSYSIGSILKYSTFSDDWYKTGVYINGRKHTGYIHKSHVDTATKNPESFTGVAEKSPTTVYTKASTSSKALRSYPKGHILKYYSFSDDWYKTGVYINGKKHTGYIHKSHVDTATKNPESFTGVAEKSPTSVYTKASTSSKALRSYPKGHILKYYSFSNDWYKTGVYINGKKHTGYIHKSHVDTATKDQKLISGIPKNSSTSVYTSASTNSKALRSYPQGRILKFYTFSDNWYETGVYLNGKKHTGYIHKSHVETITSNPEYLSGIAFKSPTSVYASPSKKSKALRNYSAGHILKFYTFTNSWYETGVYINGKKHTGYIHKDDITFNNVDYSKEYTNYNFTFEEAVGMQMKVSPQTDKYRNKPAYVSSDYIEILNGGTINNNSVRLRSSPDLGTTKNIKYTVNNGTAVIVLDTNVKGDSYSGSTKWYKVEYKGDTLYVHNSLVNINSKVGKTTDDLNVRAAKSLNSHVYGVAPKGTLLTITDEGSDWHQVSYNTWRNATRNDVSYYLNPNNFINNEKQVFQFLDLSKTSSLAVSKLNNFLKGKGILDGKGQAFIDAGNLNNINELYLLSHALLETGHGKSSLANGIKYNGVTVYNMYGIGAYDKCPIECGAKTAYENGWDTPYKAIVGGAGFIGEDYINAGQNTLYKMRWNYAKNGNGNYVATHQYATDIGWASKQVSTIYDLYQQLDSYILKLDIPNYK